MFSKSTPASTERVSSTWVRAIEFNRPVRCEAKVSTESLVSAVRPTIARIMAMILRTRC